MLSLVRYGVQGSVGRFRSPDRIRYPRGQRVVLRTLRGLEAGEVLGPATSTESDRQTDGELLRAMTVEDDLLADRLSRRSAEALTACNALIAEQSLDAVLLDAELLLDGRGLFFHFLGDPPAEAEQLTAQLAEAYEAEAQIGRFAQTLEEGCGPGCGTEEAKGQGGCASCVSCAVASACKK